MTDGDANRIHVRMNKPAADQLSQSIVAGLQRVGIAADAVGNAADSVSQAADTFTTKAGPAFRLWGAVAWADLLRRFTGR